MIDRVWTEGKIEKKLLRRELFLKSLISKLLCTYNDFFVYASIKLNHFSGHGLKFKWFESWGYRFWWGLKGGTSNFWSYRFFSSDRHCMFFKVFIIISKQWVRYFAETQLCKGSKKVYYFFIIWSLMTICFAHRDDLSTLDSYMSDDSDDSICYRNGRYHENPQRTLSYLYEPSARVSSPL